jgi:stearoyl-CoA desaturase (delta-9 desaturase)
MLHFFLVFAITLAIVQMSVFFTTMYLHRSLTHRGVEFHPWVAFLMHLEIMLFTGISPREWVAVHRKHHHFSDKEGDPHSPYLFGMWKVLFGNVIYYRRETKNPMTIRKYTPDYRVLILDRIPKLNFGALGGLALFMMMFGWIWGAAAWAFHAVAYILLNSTINSVCHMVGYRNYDNLATNLKWVAWLTGGEGLHNNHHKYPSSARFAQRKFEVDPAWPVIRMLEALRLASIKKESLASN